MIQIVCNEDPVKSHWLLGNVFPFFQPLLIPLVFQPKFESSPPPRQVSRETHVRGPTKSLQSCPTLPNAMDCSPPGFSVHGILQARILEWVAMLVPRGSSRPRDWARDSCLPRWQAGSWPLAPLGKHRETNPYPKILTPSEPILLCSKLRILGAVLVRSGHLTVREGCLGHPHIAFSVSSSDLTNPLRRQPPSAWVKLLNRRRSLPLLRRKKKKDSILVCLGR